MENNFAAKPVTPAKAALSYGLTFGILLVVLYVILYALNLNPQEGGMIGVINTFLTYLVFPFVFVLLACNHFKKLSGGYITFGQAIKTGVVVSIIAAIVLGVFNIIFNLIFPEIQAEMLQKAKESMVRQNPNMNAEQLKMGIQMAEFFMKPYILLPLSIIIYTIIGLIHSLIVGAIVKKENPGAFN